MSQYLVAIHLPDNFNSSAADEAAMGRDIDTLNEEMVAAGVRTFVGGLNPRPRGEVAASPARWEGAHHRRAVSGDQGAHRRFWVLEVADLDEAPAWGRKAVVACRAPVEVRAFGIPT